MESTPHFCMCETGLLFWICNKHPYMYSISLLKYALNVSYPPFLAF